MAEQMLSDHPALAYAVALLLTLAVETAIVTVALARWYRVAVWRGATIAIGASVLTHPVVWFVLPPLLVPAVGSTGYLLVAEGFAWLVEAGIFWLAIRRDPVGLLLVSLVANLASFTLGGLLHLFGAL
ncbi:MAG TPA: hypothetical protein VFH48_34365 [Chloroflexota bacterium]|nr:hypothetical protein [Chloroflexota bacterium]